MTEHSAEQPRAWRSRAFRLLIATDSHTSRPVISLQVSHTPQLPLALSQRGTVLPLCVCSSPKPRTLPHHPSCRHGNATSCPQPPSPAPATVFPLLSPLFSSGINSANSAAARPLPWSPWSKKPLYLSIGGRGRLGVQYPTFTPLCSRWWCFRGCDT